MQRAVQTLAVAFPSYRPRRLTGEVELGVAAAAAQGVYRPDQVSAVLNAAFDEIGGVATDLTEIRRLASGAREWLLQCAASLFWRDTGWFQSTCATCQTAYDLPLRLDAAPRKPASDRFPVVSVPTSLGARQFETPNGLHEAALARSDGSEPVRALVAACGLGPDAMRDAEAFTEDDLAAIEAAIDTASPDIADEVTTICPACKTAVQARIDPLEFAFPTMQSVLADVHTLAAAYHWSEEAILTLPRGRRRTYANLIRRETRR
ncbi:MAG: hypothetical protein ABJ251_13285 [Paracoccaceae bacterium]